MIDVYVLSSGPDYEAGSPDSVHLSLADAQNQLPVDTEWRELTETCWVGYVSEGHYWHEINKLQLQGVEVSHEDNGQDQGSDAGDEEAPPVSA